jgi:ubiquinone/menaquinone biosynthesis C-methylase UbiE
VAIGNGRPIGRGPALNGGAFPGNGDMSDQGKIWDHFQTTEEPSAMFAPERARFLFNRIKRYDTVLNVGVGSGALETLSLSAGLNVYVLDPSHKAIEKLQARLPVGDRARAGYAQDMPFGDDAFDLVVLSEVLEHLSDDIVEPSLREVARVLKPGGAALVTVPFAEDLEMGMTVCPECGYLFHRMGHVRRYRHDDLAQQLAQTGFRVDKLWVTAFCDWRRRSLRGLAKSGLKYILGRLGEGVADPHLVAWARPQR